MDLISLNHSQISAAVFTVEDVLIVDISLNSFCFSINLIDSCYSSICYYYLQPKPYGLLTKVTYAYNIQYYAQCQLS